MPSRPVVALVVACWLATTAWFAYREWWPWLGTEGPPPFVLELADEAAPQYVSWSVTVDGRRLNDDSRSRFEPQKDDTFLMTTELRGLEVSAAHLHVKVPKLDNFLRVNRTGELVRMVTHLEMELPRFKFEVWLRGRPVGTELHTRVRVVSPLGEHELDLEPAPLASLYVLSPAMPMIRFRGLMPGRTWRVSTVDPLADALLASVRQTVQNLPGAKDAAAMLANLPGAEPKELVARVLRDKEGILWEGAERPCYVVEYTGEGIRARTWVRADETAEVLRHELDEGGRKTIFERIDVRAARP